MSSTVLDDEWTTVLSEIIQSAVCAKRICILLAGQACYFLRRRSSGCNVLMGAMILSCAFAIAQMVHQVVLTVMLLRMHHSAWILETVNEQQRLEASFQRLSEAKDQQDQLLILVNNFFIDSLFIYRCYAVWGEARYRKRVICLSLILVLFTTGFGFVTILFSWNPAVSNIVVGLGMIVANLFLAGLTAGRIWWTRRQSLRVIGKTQLFHRYNTAITLVLESSALYFVLMFTFFVIQMSGSPALLESVAISVLIGASAQVMNILPALLVVRVCLARSVDIDRTAGNLKLEPRLGSSAC
ncbi:hypothetical protein K438DRAFT_1884877 [Mycena galopus ATCC 62051]|nr:hypothetical protein K438DRAFT_1884877 [Mycena galopus ATCC 62051]